jgi:hypothetical protein
LDEKPEGRDHSEDPGKDGRIILNLNLGKWVWRGHIEGSCKHSNEPLGSIKGRELLD